MWVEGQRLAHRVAWFLNTGRWPELHVCHKCDNRQCVRFSHLFEGSTEDNLNDMAKKGRRKVRRGEEVNTAKLTQAQVVSIRKKGAAEETATSLSKKYNVSQAHVSKILLNQAWKEVAPAAS